MDKKMSKGKIFGLFAFGAAIAGIGVALGVSKKAKGATPPPEPSPGMANIYGAIKDRTTGKPIYLAVLSIGGHQVLTDDSGNYVLEELATGAYTVGLSAEGYLYDMETVTLREGNNEVNFTLGPGGLMPTVDLVIGDFTIHSINGTPFLSAGGGSAVLASALELQGYQGLTINFTWKGFVAVIDYGSTLFVGQYWLPNFQTSVAPAFFAIYIDVPVTGVSPTSQGHWVSPFTTSVTPTLSTQGNGFAPGSYDVNIKIVVPGGGPGVSFTVKGITLQ